MKKVVAVFLVLCLLGVSFAAKNSGGQLKTAERTWMRPIGG
jgi:hypothetical protein